MLQLRILAIGYCRFMNRDSTCYMRHWFLEDFLFHRYSLNWKPQVIYLSKIQTNCQHVDNLTNIKLSVACAKVHSIGCWLWEKNGFRATTILTIVTNKKQIFPTEWNTNCDNPYQDFSDCFYVCETDMHTCNIYYWKSNMRQENIVHQEGTFNGTVHRTPLLSGVISLYRIAVPAT